MLIQRAITLSQINQTEIEIFLSHLLRKDRSFIQAYPEYKLNPRQIEKLQEFVDRRRKNEPLAYILGFKEFMGLDFFVDKRVMIPRPETEKLVNEVISHVYAVPNRSRKNHWKTDKLEIVDVGTGSGNIAVSLAKAIPFAKIYAVDRDKDALMVARKNIKKHKVENNVRLIQGSLLDPIHTSVDIIVANLPYIPKSRFKHLQREVTKWEPRIALDGGKDGLHLYRTLFKQTPSKIKQNGLVVYEIDGETFTNK